MAHDADYNGSMKNTVLLPVAPPARSPLAVRLIGFHDDDHEWLQAMLDDPPGTPGRYRVLIEDNLRDPDLFLANVAHPHAMAMLERLQPAALRPALLLGATPPQAVRHPVLNWPASSAGLQAAMANLLAQRRLALSGLAAHDRVSVPERRRRVDFAMAGLSRVEWMLYRRRPMSGDIVVLDDARDLTSTITRLVRPRRLKVQRVNNEAAAVIACVSAPVRLLLVHLPAADVDPYRLCADIKAGSPEHAPSVVFLVESQGDYEVDRARRAGCDGFLDGPLTSTQLLSLMQKFLPAGF
jgi:CheY-like chemotaxis protein